MGQTLDKRENRSLIYCWWEYTMVAGPLESRMWQVLQKQICISIAWICIIPQVSKVLLEGSGTSKR
jgi:hypothetical protein